MRRTTTQADALLARARRIVHDHRTRARKGGAALDYGPADVRRLLASSPCCAYCGLPVGWDASIDHKTPTARGGRHRLANLAVVCRACNLAKGQLTAEEFLQLLALLRGFHPAGGQDVLRRLRAGGRRYTRR